MNSLGGEWLDENFVRHKRFVHACLVLGNNIEIASPINISHCIQVAESGEYILGCSINRQPAGVDWVVVATAIAWMGRGDEEGENN